MRPGSAHALVLSLVLLAQGCRGGDGNAALRADTALTPEVPQPPHDSLLPPGPVGESIRRGRALLADTRDSLPEHVGNRLRCFSCHLEDGTKPGFLTLIGVYSRFPQYRSRNAQINLIEDRINDCFERSMNGKPLARDGRAMRDIVSYFAWLSRGVAPPGDIPGVGLPRMASVTPDTARGRAVFESTCTRCHGADGLGTPIAPPLWGAESFNVGAGMARLRTAAAFIRYNMPNDRVVVLSDSQAFDVAAYVVSRPRPDFAKKVDDWPYGDAPPDVAYPTRSTARKVAAPNP
ncbi:MAG TPA: c-type cytochrome [Gemmatimonadales bacterium]|nr:c-type cytochrome [Gemmatimonadales bacterium]